MITEYTIYVDTGIPYELKVKGKAALFAELRKLRLKVFKENLPYCEIEVYKSSQIDVTDAIFKEMEARR